MCSLVIGKLCTNKFPGEEGEEVRSRGRKSKRRRRLVSDTRVRNAVNDKNESGIQGLREREKKGMNFINS